jgi:hypothetical protein
VPLVLFGKRNMKIVIPETRLRQVKAQAVRTADRVGPMATQARDTANEKIVVARGWAAPKLDAAAHSIAEEIAPKISAMMSQAAARIDPAPAVKTRNRAPMLLLLMGLAVGAVGYAMYRKNADQWADSMKDSASDASHWVGQKTETTADRVSGATHDAASKADEFGGKADSKADQISKKMS